MMNVAAAMVPRQLPATLIFGVRALVLVLVSVAFSVFFEYIYRKLMHLELTISDWSAVVTGMLIAFNVPSTLPVWMVILRDAVRSLLSSSFSAVLATTCKPCHRSPYFPADFIFRPDDHLG